MRIDHNFMAKPYHKVGSRGHCGRHHSSGERHIPEDQHSTDSRK